MGLLDDAIREHLDLKRRRGADPAEVERLEREALGPVRRGPAPVDSGADGMTGTDAGFLTEPRDEFAEERGAEERWERDERWHEAPGAAEYEPRDERDAPVEHDVWEEEEEGPVEPVRPVEFQRRSLRDRLSRREVPFEEEDQDDVVAGATPAPHPAAAPPPEPALPPHLNQETVEYQALEHDLELEDEHDPRRERSADAAHEPRGEEILEETPDFLQDTPDHDRLWFEQRPPRDFDFDE